MATIVALTSNDWSSTTNNDPWPGGTKPGTGDTVQCADYTITIDEDIEVVAIELDGAHTGGFLVDTAPCSITANVIQSSSDAAPCLTLSHATDTVTITGTISTTGGGNAVYQTGAGDLAIIGSFAGDAVACLLMIAGGDLTVTGDINGGASEYAAGADLYLTGDVVIDGDVTGGSATFAFGIMARAANSIAVTNVTGGSSGYITHGICCQENYVGSDTYIPITVSDSVIAGDGYLCWGIVANSVVIADRLIGNASEDGGLAVSNNGSTTARSFEVALGGPFPCGGYGSVIIDATAGQIIVYDDTDTARTLSDDYPAVADVKDGVIYNLGTMEGELVAGGGGGWSININGVISRT